MLLLLLLLLLLLHYKCYYCHRDTIADDICASLSPIRADWDPSGSKLDIDDVTSRLVRRFARVCQNVPVTNNIYLDLFLRSSRASFREVERKLPPYLKPENFEKLKVNLFLFIKKFKSSTTILWRAFIVYRRVRSHYVVITHWAMWTTIVLVFVLFYLTNWKILALRHSK